jgi:hypothetical protein
MYSRCVTMVFYIAFVRKCTDICKHRFGVQLLQNPPLCISTVETYHRKNFRCDKNFTGVMVMFEFF